MPPELARYCAVRVPIRLRPGDTHETEVTMLDHSALPFVCVNALQVARSHARCPASRTPGLPDSRTPGLPDSRTPKLPNSQTPKLPNSQTPKLPNSLPLTT